MTRAPVPPAHTRVPSRPVNHGLGHRLPAILAGVGVGVLMLLLTVPVVHAGGGFLDLEMDDEPMEVIEDPDAVRERERREEEARRLQAEEEARRLAEEEEARRKAEAEKQRQEAEAARTARGAATRGTAARGPGIGAGRGDGTGLASSSTYPDEDGFKTRATRLLQQASKQDLQTYRRGWWVENRGANPGKYTIPMSIARLSVNKDDADALRVMADDKSTSEHYSFAAIGWVRYMGLFGDTLPLGARQALSGRGDDNFIRRQSTDNHEAMYRTSAILYPKLGMRGNADAGKQWLRNYVKTLYQVGQPEWNSSRYVPWSMMGFLNLYDFSDDEEVRLLAKAALDWWAATYAQRYVNGLQAGPSERALYLGPCSADIDLYGWLWFGAQGASPQDRHAYIASYGATSTYRPNAIIHNLATRKHDLPYEARNTKPNYWSGLDVPPLTPEAAFGGYETLWVSSDFTLGTLWYGEDKCAQVGRFQGAIRTGNGAVGFTGGTVGQQNGRDRWTEGQGSLIESLTTGHRHPITWRIEPSFVQVGPVAACIARFEDDSPNKFTFVSIPRGARPTQAGKWWTMSVGNVQVAVRPFSDQVEVARSDAFQYLKIGGNPSGFLVAVSDGTTPVDLRALESSLDLSKFQSDETIAFKVPDGRAVTMKYTRPKRPTSQEVKQTGQRGAFSVHECQVYHRPLVTIDDATVSYDDAPIHASPFLFQDQGRLLVNDGKNGFIVDFSGNAPVYREWDGQVPTPAAGRSGRGGTQRRRR